MWEFWNIILRYDLNKIINERDCKKRKRINELHEKRLNLFRKLLEPPSYPFLIKTCSEIILRDAINKIDAEIAQLEREIAEDRYNQSKGESKMDNREELKRSLAEEEQRAKDSLANVEKMKKQLEELNKKEEQPTVSATGVYLNNTMDYLYSLDCDNSILYQLSSNNNIDIRIKKLNINNAFENENSAKQEALRREGQEFIRRCAMLWNKSNDWRKIKNIIQYCIRFNGYKLEIDYFSNNQYGQPFFDTRELAERCITELKAKYNEEQIKIIFGVK